MPPGGAVPRRRRGPLVTLDRRADAPIEPVRPHHAAVSAHHEDQRAMNAGQGSAGNVIAAICSLIIPGLGQLVQGRIISAIFWFVAACIAFGITWLITLSLLPFGWFVVSIFSCISAAMYRRP
jgi:TM2 domain-containing membrane protein YozV